MSCARVSRPRTTPDRRSPRQRLPDVLSPPHRDRLVSHPHAKNSLLSRLGHFAFATAVLATAGRIAYLACTTAGWLGSSASEPPAASRESLGSTGPTAAVVGELSTASRARADAELAEFYKACPLAAVIDLETVANSPEKVDAILPPYRETADHVPNPAYEPAVPRIRYPVRIAQAQKLLAPPGRDWARDRPLNPPLAPPKKGRETVESG